MDFSFDNLRKMKTYFTIFVFAIVTILIPDPSFVKSDNFETSEIQAYHFHTYYFQTNPQSTDEALSLRNGIQDQIDSGFLAECRLNHFNRDPIGPHIIGSFETCCNKSSISQALSFFMLNHGNLTIFLHPLTRYEVLDHTTRSMFLGKPLPLDLSPLATDLGDNIDHCVPFDQ